MKVFRENRREAIMEVTDGELLVTQTERATKYAVISEIRKDIELGECKEIADYLNDLIKRIENLEV